MNITHLTGDATRPSGQGRKIIAHICNDQGRWGKGFVVAISARWPEPEEIYCTWFDENAEFELGAVQFVQVERDIFVANMIGQEGIREKSGIPPIRYAAVWSALQKVGEKA
jgi:hypothetical protein